jgi:hypothetical protein
VAGSQTYDEKEAERAWAELLPFYKANLANPSGGLRL